MLIVLLPMLSMQLCSNESEIENSNESERSNDCENTTLIVTSLEETYDCVNTKYGLHIDLDDNFTLIRSQSEFTDLVSGNCQPTIDFTIYDLVIGKKHLINGNDTIGYDLLLNCETSTLELTVVFNQNLSDVAPNITYHALIPKLSATQTLTVDIQIN